ncbi:hypothetical protein CVT24_004085 [Panaeolus cyanescens]|uniref:Zn(2)-C6 fungal-type domain-containing protein n=1 Tax=Panaeolus cyanescens TaxID=181874 RepID=A0A409Y5W0_9AGAR|nr:hypothetical protein CVT24_004085 [Panaeolus cyanescens]
MDDTFQFIIESPQHATGHKKRPRLVTSCDNCRLKKIKCLQPSPETKCEACKAAKIPCRFRDRERYFAERSRAIAGPNSGSYAAELRPEPHALDAFSVASGSSSPSLSSHSDPRSNSHSPKASGMVSAEIENPVRYAPYPDSRQGIAASHKHSRSISSSRSNNGAPYPYTQSPQILQYPTNTRNSYQPDQRSLHLFDETHQRPHPQLMPTFIQLFFQHHGTEFAFLTYQDILADFWEHTLSPGLANCIAAMAVKHSHLPEFTARELHNVAENYIDLAKNLLSSIAHSPSLDTLHSLMLVCWFEHTHHRLPGKPLPDYHIRTELTQTPTDLGFRNYYAMASKMAADLGLTDAHSTEIYSGSSDYERNRRRTTWTGMVQLHMTYNSSSILYTVRS